MTDNAKPKATGRSPGASKQRHPRPVAYPHTLILRVDSETMAMLEQDAKENDRTVSQTARRLIWKGREVDG